MMSGKTNKKEESTKKEGLKEVFALWERESQKGLPYFSGVTSDELGKKQLVAYYTTIKKNPKEPDIRVYVSAEDVKQEDKEVASLWGNVSKNNLVYYTGLTDDMERIVAFPNTTKKNEKEPDIRIYLSNENI